jgi:hypothetical protein
VTQPGFDVTIRLQAKAHKLLDFGLGWRTLDRVDEGVPSGGDFRIGRQACEVDGFCRKLEV